jgi:hypothetical protein
MAEVSERDLPSADRSILKLPFPEEEIGGSQLLLGPLERLHRRALPQPRLPQSSPCSADLADCSHNQMPAA